jgi:hypothetical protein
MDGLTVDGNAEISSAVPILKFMQSDGTDQNAQLRLNSNSFYINQLNDDGTTNRPITLFNVATGDVSFYEDTGTTAKLFWDASAESLGIGTTSPDTKLDVTTGGVAGIILNQDTSNSAASSRLFFKDSTRTNAIVNIDGNLELRTGATIGVSSGTPRLVVNGDGNVGIGTSSPASFDAAGDNLVVGTGSGNNGMTVYSGTANAGSLFFADGTGTAAEKADGYIQYTHSNQELAFATGGGSERVRFDNSGDVIIKYGDLVFSATSTFAYMGNVSISIPDRAATQYNPGDRGNITIQASSATSGNQAMSGGRVLINAGNSNNGQSGDIILSSGVNVLNSNDRGKIRFNVGGRTTNEEVMRIDASGNVGIGTGTSSPSSPLQVVKNASSNTTPIASFSTTIANDYGIVEINSGVDNNYRPSTLRFKEGGNLKWEIGGTYQLVDDSFGIRNSSGAYKMVIEEAGNVGIGTTSPSGELHVDSALAPCDIHFTTGSTSGTGYDVNLNMTGGANNSEMNLNMGIAGNADREQIKTYQSTMRFTTADTERMRIDSSGRLMVNQTSVSAASAGGKMQVAADVLSTGSLAGFFWENRSGMTIASQSGWGGWYSTSTASHFLYSDGSNIASINRSSGGYTPLSDKNKKKDFEDSTVGLAEVMQLKPKKFRMLEDADDAPKKLGFIAQDVENVIPEAYVEDTNEDASGVENTFIGLTDRPIIAALTKAIQEQQTIIDDLKSRIETLEG